MYFIAQNGVPGAVQYTSRCNKYLKISKLSGSVAIGSDPGLAVRLLPLFGSRTPLLLSSLFVSSPRGIDLLAALEHLVLMS